MDLHVTWESFEKRWPEVRNSSPFFRFISLENLVPAQVSVQRRTESYKKQSNTTQQNGTVMETN